MSSSGWWFVAVLAALSLLPLLAWFVLAWFSIHPVRAPLFLSPYDFDIPFDEVEFPSRDGDLLRAWWMPNPQNRAVVLVLHGYLCNRCETMGVAGTLYRAGFSILTFDFRAHGKSSGRVCTLGARETRDAQGALDWLDAHARHLPVAVFGSSMGGATAILLAAQDERVQAVATDCAFSDLREAGGDWWASQSGALVGRLLRPANTVAAWMAKTSVAHASPKRVIAQIAPRPVLILHAQGDMLIPVRHAQALFDNAREPKTLHTFAEGGHVQARADFAAEFYGEVVPFFQAWANGVAKR